MNFKLWLEDINQAKLLANKVAAKLRCQMGGSCMYFAEWATKVFLKNGINDFLVVEGWVKAKNEQHWRQHTWIEIEGQKIDPTFIQFDALGNVNYVSKVKKKYTPQEYLALSAKYPDEWAQLPKYIKRNDDATIS